MLTLSEKQREQIERALDELYDIVMDEDEQTGDQLLRGVRAYTKAIAIVRERPEGFRKVRSDFMSKRKTPQQELI